jgi:DUF4097 and DUF4098 domain-containing protein YvlB
MKLLCPICKIEKELTKEQVEYMTKLIETNPNAKAYDYIEIAAIMLESNCMGNDRHSFQFSEDFSKAVDESVANVNKYQEEFNKLDSRDIELKNKLKIMYKEIRNLAEERANIIENKNTTSDVLLMVKEAFKNVSGTDNVKLWS